MAERKAVMKATGERYQRGRKKEKQKLLDEFVELTGYNRSYARTVLRNHGRQAGRHKKPVVNKRRRALRGQHYDQKVLEGLRRIWMILDFICGKRLVAIMPEVVKRLEYFGEFKCDRRTREKLLKISAATIDRLLAPERRKHQLRGRARTKPGTLLKKQIPLRTFSEWSEQRPGFVEIDLVAHDGGLAAGEYLYTLDMTDVYSGWTEVQAIQNKAQVWVFAALKELRAQMPFALQGIDSDNGSEFINDNLLEYCQHEGITFTRARPYRKNDNCFVEQKNYTMVRRQVGYQRLSGAEQLALVNELYRHLRLYANYFQPLMKLKSKERNGSQVKKTYHPAQTPYQRLRGSAHLSAAAKQRLTREYAQLNPADLKRKIERCQTRLLQLAANARPQRLHPRHQHGWTNDYFFAKSDPSIRVDFHLRQ
jgi:integrase-like protein